MSTWEQRMAARARERQARARAMAPRDASDISWERAQREEWQLQARMTLGEAMRLLQGPSWACACTGFPDCCVYRGAQTKALQRGAHIVAKLLADATRPRYRFGGRPLHFSGVNPELTAERAQQIAEEILARGDRLPFFTVYGTPREGNDSPTPDMTKKPPL